MVVENLEVHYIDQIQNELIAKGIERDKIARVNIMDKDLIERGEWKTLFCE